jgi:hypothetical protein
MREKRKMKLGQFSVVHETDGFRWTSEWCHFSTQLQFQFKRLCDVTGCQHNPTMSQNPGEQGHFRSKVAGLSS